MKQNPKPIATPVVYTEEQDERIEEMEREALIEYEREAHVQEDD